MTDATEAEKNEAHRQRMIELKQKQDAERKARTERRGVLIVNTGDGKGKSTSAFGLALRAAGNDMRVGLVQFIKGKWKTGEQAAIKRFPEIEHVIAGEGFTWETQDRARDIEVAKHGWSVATRMMDEAAEDPSRYQVLILDELNIALRYDYLPIDDVVARLKARPEHLHVVVTGRDAKPELIEAADTVSEVRAVKHAYEAGIKAQRGIEF